MSALGARPNGRWPSWVDDVLAYGPIAELETEWKAAIGDAIVHILDLRKGSIEITCACCGATKPVPGEAGRPVASPHDRNT